MTREQAEEWFRAGMEVGSHTRTHARLTQCDTSACLRELCDSKTELEDVIGEAVVSLSYPYGDYNDEVVACAREAGYRQAVTTRGGRMRRGDDLLRLRRIGVNGGNGIARFLFSTMSDYQLWRERRSI